MTTTNEERACTAHFHDQPYESESYIGDNGCSYIMLRCTTCHRPQGARLMRRPRITALHIHNGETIILKGQQRQVTATHYSGPIDGSGTVTLEFGYGKQWQGPATTRFTLC